MYGVIFKNDYHGRWSIMSDNHRTLADAANARKVSGDLVVDKRDFKVPADDSWLWAWEREDASTYAHRHLGWQIDRNKRG